MLATRIEKIAEVNRRRRPDRERSLVDDLLAHARKLLLDGDPAAYLAGFDDEFRDRVVDALLAGDGDAARTALGAARARGVTDAAILALLESRRASLDGAGAAARPRTRRGHGRRRRRAAPELLIPLSAVGLGTWCPACGAVASAGAATCPNCQSDLQLRCDSCGQLAAADLRRCPHCGALLDEPREPLLARRAALRAETAALAEVDRLPAAEREGRLRTLARAHPEWPHRGPQAGLAAARAAARRAHHDLPQRGARHLGGRRERGRLPRRAPRPTGLARARSDVDARVDGLRAARPRA